MKKLFIMASMMSVLSLYSKTLKTPDVFLPHTLIVRKPTFDYDAKTQTYNAVVEPGEQFVIETYETGSTGYMLFDAIMLESNGNVRTLQREHIPSHRGESTPITSDHNSKSFKKEMMEMGPIGAPTPVYFHVEAPREGSALILIIHARPWDFSTADIQRYTITVSRHPEKKGEPAKKQVHEITGTVGEQLQISIPNYKTIAPANQITYIRNEVSNKDVISPVEYNGYKPPTSGLMGAPGHDEFTFTALKKGHTTITFYYQIGLDQKDVQPKVTYKVHIR